MAKENKTQEQPEQQPEPVSKTTVTKCPYCGADKPVMIVPRYRDFNTQCGQCRRFYKR